MKDWMSAAAEEIALISDGPDAKQLREIIAKHHESIAKPEPGYICDWAARCGTYLHAEGVKLSSHRIAAVVAFFAEPLVALLREGRREHKHDDVDVKQCCPRCTCLSWTDDPEGDFEPTPNGDEPCTCGADAWNARVDEVLAGGEGNP